MTAPSERLLEATLDLLWRQWRAVGAHVAAEGAARAIVDVEALLLASLALQSRERRLTDVATSWVRANAGLVSIQRLRNLARAFPEEARDALASLARVARDDAKDARWGSLADDRALPIAAREGKSRSGPAPIGAWPALQLQLRRGMGVGTRADILCFLLGSRFTAEWFPVAVIAAATGYTPAAVRRAADDLAAAHFLITPLTAAHDRAPQRLYGAAAEPWAMVLGVAVQQPGWGWWAERFLFVLETVSWLEALPHRAVGAYARDVEAADLLARHERALLHDGAVEPESFLRAPRDAALLEQAVEQLGGWLRHRG